MRRIAFDRVREIVAIYGNVPSFELSNGFEFDGEHIRLASRPRGIFKPKQMRFPLSIRTAFPRPGRKIWYDDQRNVHQQIFAGDETVDYAFMGNNPNHPDNRGLREVGERHLPLVYFLGIAPEVYLPIFPVFVFGWDARALKVQIAFGEAGGYILKPPKTIPERRYALREVKQRLHQASFRESVIEAYKGRCAVSGLPVRRLLDAAHIMADSDEHFGQPVVPNGLPLSKIHHAAFDAHLLGIDADFSIHVSEKLQELKDGVILESLKQLEGQKLYHPRRHEDWPDRDRLAQRFELFKAAT
jgi:putative restriction endonuclease